LRDDEKTSLFISSQSNKLVSKTFSSQTILSSKVYELKKEKNPNPVSIVENYDQREDSKF